MDPPFRSLLYREGSRLLAEGGFTWTPAVKIGGRIEPYRPVWLEDPTAHVTLGSRPWLPRPLRIWPARADRCTAS